MIITCTDEGGVLVPSVEFDNPGKINPGWFEKHHSLFLRAIQRANVEVRTGRSYDTREDSHV